MIIYQRGEKLGKWGRGQKRRQRRAGIQRVFVERPPMKGETSIVYHARFEAKVSPKLNCLDEHEARGLWIQIVDCYRPRPSPFPPTLIPRVFSIKLRDPAVPLTKLTIHKLTFLNNELNYIQSNRSPFFAPINGHFSFIIPHSTLSLILEEHLPLPF